MRIDLRVVVVVVAAWAILESAAQEKPKPDTPDEKQKEAIERHVRNLKSSFAADRIRAAQELAKFGEDGKPGARGLCEMIVESNSKIALAGLDSLEKVWPDLHKHIVTILADKDKRKRAAAVKEIAFLEEGDVAAPILVENVKRHITEDDFFGPDESVALSIDALKRFAPKNQLFVNVLLVGGGPLNPRQNNRMIALGALGELAEENPKSAPQIKKLLTASLADRNAKIRVAALKGIGSLGKNGKDMATINAVKRLKLDSDEEVRNAATAALDKLQNDQP